MQGRSDERELTDVSAPHQFETRRLDVEREFRLYSERRRSLASGDDLKEIMAMIVAGPRAEEQAESSPSPVPMANTRRPASRPVTSRGPTTRQVCSDAA